jgi:hypothetical protein
VVLWRLLAAIAFALLAYGSLFALLGVAVRRPLTAALVFVFGWERLVMAPGLLPRLTLTGHLRALAGDPAAPMGLHGAYSAGVLLVVALLALAAATAVFRRGEYVPEP